MNLMAATHEKNVETGQQKAEKVTCADQKQMEEHFAVRLIVNR